MKITTASGARSWLVLGAVFMTAACAPNDPVRTTEGVAIRSIELSGAGTPTADAGEGFLGFEMMGTNSAGVPYACDPSAVELHVEVSYDDGESWVDVPSDGVQVFCYATPAGTVGLVLDNSGSQQSVLDATQVGADALVSATIARGGQLSLTRVSTGSSVLHEVTTDAVALQQEIDDLFVNGGWTALYDGIRMGHETLAAPGAPVPTNGYETLSHFCEKQDRPAMVVFTNGVDNNSANEESPLYADGIDTTYEDLLGLQVGGITTPIFSIGLGDNVDHDLLTELANQSGGLHLSVAEAQAIPTAFDLIGAYETESLKVCAPLEIAGCGSAVVRIDYTFSADETEYSDTVEYEANVPCPE